MSTNDTPGDGDVEILLKKATGNDPPEKFLLRPSLKAALMLSKNDGLRGRVRRCATLEFDVIQEVIELGLGRTSKDLSARIYNTGLRNLSGECIQFLSNLSNGGVPITEGEEDGNPPTLEGGRATS